MSGRLPKPDGWRPPVLAMVSAAFVVRYYWRNPDKRVYDERFPND